MFDSQNFPTFIHMWKSLTDKTRRAPTRKRPVLSSVPTAQKTQFVLRGPLLKLDDRRFMVDGEEIAIDESTWVFGELITGAEATVHGVFRRGFDRYATKIVSRCLTK